MQICFRPALLLDSSLPSLFLLIGFGFLCFLCALQFLLDLFHFTLQFHLLRVQILQLSNAQRREWILLLEYVESTDGLPNLKLEATDCDWSV